jgi:hypothetical protein
MKRTILFSIIILFLSAQLFAQSTFTQNMSASSEDGAIAYYVEATVHGATDTLITNSIDLSKGIYNIPIFAKKLFNSVTAKPKLKIVRQESLFGAWRDAKTEYTSDSIETYQNFTADTLRAPSNRFLIMGAAGNPTDTSVKIYWRFLRLQR